MSDQQKNNYDILDLFKFILSLFVVARHCAGTKEQIFPWVDLAVPLFFIISSYLFFKKIRSAADDIECRKIFFKYLKRMTLYYLFWFVVFIPYNLHYHHEWFTGKIFENLKTIHELLLATPTPMWYVVSSIIVTTILYLLRKVNIFVLAPFVLIIYCFCYLWSFDIVYFPGNQAVIDFVHKYKRVLPSPNLSFPIALCWMFIGECFAVHDCSIKNKPSKLFRYYLFVFVILSACLLYKEHYFYLSKYQLMYGTKIMYLVLVPALFLLIKDIDIKLANPKLLRAISATTYPAHYRLIVMYRDAFKSFITNENQLILITFIVVVATCNIIAITFSILEKNKYLRFLKWSH